MFVFIKDDRLVDPETRLRRLLAQSESYIRGAVLTAIAYARRSAGTLTELADLIEAGRVDEAVRRAGQLIGARTAEAANTAFVLSGTATARVIDTGIVEIAVSYDQTHQRAVNEMREARLHLIREFTDEQRAATRAALVEGVTEGVNPRQQARYFRDSIGLTRRQQAAVSNYRRLLRRAAVGDSEALTRQLRDRRFDRSVARAARERQPLSPAQVDRMVDRYRERYIRYRAEVIARTESLWSVHAGNEEAFSQAVEQGAFTAEEVRRGWSTRLDGRERESHHHANRQEVPLGRPFLIGGTAVRYPGDRRAPAREIVQCRCSLYTRVVDAA